jgi:hypothetical protein
MPRRKEALKCPRKNCPTPGFNTYSKLILSSHLIRSHFECRVGQCKFKGTDSESIGSHLWKKHSRCVGCTKTFLNERTLEIHVKKNHQSTCPFCFADLSSCADKGTLPPLLYHVVANHRDNPRFQLEEWIADENVYMKMLKDVGICYFCDAKLGLRYKENPKKLPPLIKHLATRHGKDSSFNYSDWMKKEEFERALASDSSSDEDAPPTPRQLFPPSVGVREVAASPAASSRGSENSSEDDDESASSDNASAAADDETMDAGDLGEDAGQHTDSSEAASNDDESDAAASDEDVEEAVAADDDDDKAEEAVAADDDDVAMADDKAEESVAVDDDDDKAEEAVADDDVEEAVADDNDDDEEAVADDNVEEAVADDNDEESHKEKEAGEEAPVVEKVAADNADEISAKEKADAVPNADKENVENQSVAKTNKTTTKTLGARKVSRPAPVEVPIQRTTRSTVAQSQRSLRNRTPTRKVQEQQELKRASPTTSAGPIRKKSRKVPEGKQASPTKSAGPIRKKSRKIPEEKPTKSAGPIRKKSGLRK